MTCALEHKLRTGPLKTTWRQTAEKEAVKIGDALYRPYVTPSHKRGSTVKPLLNRGNEIGKAINQSAKQFIFVWPYPRQELFFPSEHSWNSILVFKGA